MASFVMDVCYEGWIVETTVVEAETEEEAMQKIREGDYDDVIDVFIEKERITDMDFR